MILGHRLKSVLARLGLMPEELIPTETLGLKAIGIVRNRVREPRMDGWESVLSDIIVRKNLTDALDGIDGYSHILVLFYLHRVSDEERTRIKIHPRGDARYPLRGIFATRTQHRPNPIGASVVTLVRRRRNVLRVRGLDAINGTPIIDLKPYVPHFDAPSDAQVPEWINQPLPPP